MKKSLYFTTINEFGGRSVVLGAIFLGGGGIYVIGVLITAIVLMCCQKRGVTQAAL